MQLYLLHQNSQFNMWKQLSVKLDDATINDIVNSNKVLLSEECTNTAARLWSRENFDFTLRKKRKRNYKFERDAYITRAQFKHSHEMHFQNSFKRFIFISTILCSGFCVFEFYAFADYIKGPFSLSFGLVIYCLESIW